MKHQGYFTRALQANDPRYARVFGKLGYSRSDLSADQQDEPAAPADPAAPPAPAAPEEASADLTALREQYHAALGKKPFHGWDAAELTKRIAEAGQAKD